MEAVFYLAGFIHNDIKTDNVLLSDDSTAVQESGST